MALRIHCPHHTALHLHIKEAARVESKGSCALDNLWHVSANVESHINGDHDMIRADGDSTTHKVNIEDCRLAYWNAGRVFEGEVDLAQGVFTQDKGGRNAGDGRGI